MRDKKGEGIVKKGSKQTKWENDGKKKEKGEKLSVKNGRGRRK